MQRGTRGLRKKGRHMAATRYIRPTVSVMPATPPLLAPQPPIAPLTPPVHVVDLMTAEGSAVFGAVWRGIEAKLVECPALADAMPEFRTTYDVEPHAELLGFDDSAWPVIAADDLGGGAGGGLISFFLFRGEVNHAKRGAGLRHQRGKGGAARKHRRLCGDLDQRRIAARRRTAEPSLHPRLQHAEPAGARRQHCACGRALSV